MKSSRPATLKGQANQIIKQIVKVVLPSDVVQLQPGRKPKRRVKGAKKRKTQRVSEGLPPRPPPPPMYPSVFGANVPSAFMQPAFQQPSSTPFEKMLLEKLQQVKETPKPPAVVSVPSSSTTPMGQTSAPSSITPTIGSVSVSDLQRRSRSVLSELGALQTRARSQARELEKPSIAPSSSSTLTPASLFATPPPVRPAPNQANQPSVDVDGDGKESRELRPVTPARTFVQASPALSPNQGIAAQASSSQEVFKDIRAITRELSPPRVENPKERLDVLKPQLDALIAGKPSSKGKGAKARLAEWERQYNPLASEYRMLIKELEKHPGASFTYFEESIEDFPVVSSNE